MLKVINQELKYSRQDKYLSIRNASDRNPLGAERTNFLQESQNNSGPLNRLRNKDPQAQWSSPRSDRVNFVRRHSQDSQNIDKLTKRFAELKLNLVKFKDEFRTIRQDVKALSYNRRRNNLRITSPKAVNSVQQPLAETNQSDSKGGNTQATISALLFKKDGSPRVCYRCTSQDHDAYQCDKLRRLSSNSLLTASKLEGSSIFLGSPEDAQAGLSEHLDPTCIRLYRNQSSYGLERYIHSQLEFLSKKGRSDLPCVARYRKLVKADPSFKGEASLSAPKAV